LNATQPLELGLASHALVEVTGQTHCGDSIRAAWAGGTEVVVALPEWREVLERNPSNRHRFLDQDPKEFIASLERWMAAYCPCGDELVPGAGHRRPQARHPDPRVPERC
jgi:hypothetical protein